LGFSAILGLGKTGGLDSGLVGNSTGLGFSPFFFSFLADIFSSLQTVGGEPSEEELSVDGRLWRVGELRKP
jgi:hypothetical protein